MRIIDKNTDFYDYYQNVYKDDSIVFDRTDSFLLTKDIMCGHLHTYDTRWDKSGNVNFVLLQVCNTFWLFLAELVQGYHTYKPVDYSIKLLKTWKNYNKEREMLALNVISFDCSVSARWKDDTFHIKRTQEKEDKNNVLVSGVNNTNYKIVSSVNKHTVYYGDGKSVDKHIPILKASGFANQINALDLYLALEEYFSLEKTSSERIYSVGITNDEKIENHGFDTKISFRGKR